MKYSYRKNRTQKFKGRDEIEKLQNHALREHINFILENSPAYKKKLAGLGINSSEMTKADLATLPLTTKEEIEKNSLSFLAVESNKIADIVLSSGTTGRPIEIHYTESDLQRLAYNECESFSNCGLDENDIALLTCTMDRCFIAGLAYFLGMRELGVSVIRNGHGAIESHLDLIERMKPTVIVGVPTFLRKLGQALDRIGNSAEKSSVEKIICIGEPIRNEKFELLGIGEDLKRIWNAKLFSTYASSETITTFCECSGQRGGHLIPELAIVEIIDDEGNVLGDGQVGEVVVTPLAIEGMPLLRYRTGDISFLETSPCSCGNFAPRLGPILGRRQQRMKIKGTSIYPQAVFCVLDEMDLISHYYIEAFDASELSDEVLVHVSVNDEQLTREKIEEQLAIKLRVRLQVVVESDQDVRRKVFLKSSRKPVRFYDCRKESAYVSTLK